MAKDNEVVDMLLAEGKSCSQVMVEMTMKKLGVEDTRLLDAAKGLSGGMGIRHACGCVTGAACAMSLADPEKGITTLFPQWYQWFYEAYGDDHGGINCIELLDGDFDSRKKVCPGMIAASWEKAREVMEENGVIPS